MEKGGRGAAALPAPCLLSRTSRESPTGPGVSVFQSGSLFALDLRLHPVQASRPVPCSRCSLHFCHHLRRLVRRLRPRSGAARAASPALPLGAWTARSISECVTRGRGADRRMHGVSHLLPWSPEPGLRFPHLLFPSLRGRGIVCGQRGCAGCAPGRLPFRIVRIGGLYTELKHSYNIIVFKHVSCRDFLIFISPRKSTFLGT